MIQVICPTIAGREDSVRRCMAAYEQRTVDEVNFIVVYGEETCGKAWQRGVELAGAGYRHFTADDLEPLGGWDIDARQAADDGLLPAPVIYTRDSGQVEQLGVTPDGFFSRIPFCTEKQWEQIGPMIPIHYYCVPTDHRILTRDGWKRQEDLELGELVMAFDPFTQEMRWEPLLAINVFPYAGDLMRFERKGDVFEFTANHRWPVVNNRGLPMGFREARHLKSHHQVPIRGEFSGTESVLSPRHAAILGWVVGDGSYNLARRQMVVYQKNRIQEVTALLERDPIPSVIGKGVRTWYVHPEDKHVIEELFSSKRDLPGIVAKLSREAAASMLEALFLAEGSRTSAGGRVIAQSISANPEVREAIQILALMTGSNASLHSKDVFLKTSRFMHATSALATPRAYTGHVWCPSTPSGTWIMEHDGAAIPTGNTDNWFSWQGNKAGFLTVEISTYAFKHHWAMTGRYGQEKMTSDYAAYENYKRNGYDG